MASNGKSSNGVEGFAKGVSAEPSRPATPKTPTPRTTIPQVVANRMARRVVIGAGIPTSFGMGTFIVSYLLVTRQIVDVQPAVTLFVSGGFFALGLVGLSYGLFSSSWLPEPGTLLGFEQIGPNIKRLRNGAVARQSEPR
ncbi:MAG: hypothetical protein CBB79_07650 [Synechococcus sp. TMED19]|nr:MAG: hypothetical protein CBB79_07650 [Synechococcus sp. TMED19]